jgi:hypothetical protein
LLQPKSLRGSQRENPVKRVDRSGHEIKAHQEDEIHPSLGCRIRGRRNKGLGSCVGNSSEHDGKSPELLDEDGVPALGFADRFLGHEEYDADDDDVGDEEEDVTGSTELVASVDFGIAGAAPGAAEEVADEGRQEDDVDGTDGAKVAIETPVGMLPCSDPASQLQFSDTLHLGRYTTCG